jgi:histidinol-phosphate aminotransferase
MSPFPRADYAALRPYDPGRIPVRVDLSDNTNLWGPHPAALARIRAATADDLRCYPEVYADTLRRAVAERFGVGIDCVTTGVGSDDVLDSSFRAASGPGGVVSYPAPTFSMIGDLARMNGMEPRPVGWQDAVDDPRWLLEGGPALVYLCRPNNPTGALLPAEWVEKLLGLRDPDGPLVVIDEAYADFSPDSLIEWAARLPRLLVARTCSKAYGLAGLRCGFGVGRPDVVLEVEKARGPYKVSRLTAEVAALVLRDADGWIGRTVAECLDNRDRLRGELEKRGLRTLASHANFILVAAPSGSAKADNDAFREHGVTTRPFTGIPEIGEGLRVTMAPWRLLERFLEALDLRLGALKEIAAP